VPDASVRSGFTAAVAQDAAPPAPSRPAAATDTTTAPVRIEGRRVFEVSGSGASSATERVARINRRLQGLIERDELVPPFTPQDIIEQNGDHIVTIGGAPIVTITRSDAADTLSSPRELALLHGSRLAAADARAGRASPLRGTGILIRNSFRDLVVSTVSWLPRAAGALLLLFVFWGLARFGRWATRLATLRLNLDANLRQLKHWCFMASGSSAALPFFLRWGWKAAVSRRPSAFLASFLVSLSKIFCRISWRA
jgi:hypothetical protein